MILSFPPCVSVTHGTARIFRPCQVLPRRLRYEVASCEPPEMTLVCLWCRCVRARRCKRCRCALFPSSAVECGATERPHQRDAARSTGVRQVLSSSVSFHSVECFPRSVLIAWRSCSMHMQRSAFSIPEREPKLSLLRVSQFGFAYPSPGKRRSFEAASEGCLLDRLTC